MPPQPGILWEIFMHKRQRLVLLVALVAALLALVTTRKSAFAQDTASVPKPQDYVALGEPDARRLLLLIGPNKDGKITKQAWMKFMSAEFDRLDNDKSGSLDVKELAVSRLQATPFAASGK